MTKLFDYYNMSKGKNYKLKKGKLMNYYKEIKTKLIDNEIYCKAKDYSKDKNTVLTYYEIGKLLSEAGKKYNITILKRMRQFYLLIQKGAPLAHQLSLFYYTSKMGDSSFLTGHFVNYIKNYIFINC